MKLDIGHLQSRHDELTQKITEGAFSGADRAKFQKELSILSNLIAKLKEIESLEKDHADALEQSKSSDAEMAELFKEEAASLEARVQQERSSLDDLLFPPDEEDKCSAFVEIRAGAGGQEAALFASDLLRLYSNYALNKGWRVSIVDASQTDLKGYKDVTLHIEGKDVYGEMKFESGVHRVQRVPETEGSGRVHTSTITVAVLPELKDEDVVDISPADLRIDYFRASGAGGQHVNTTDSAVRITHLPTGVVVSCQDERSQHKNRNKAMKILSSRIYEAQRLKKEEEMSQKRKSLVGAGMRAEKIRTYNYPQNRVSDHRINLTLKKLDMIMEGDLSEVMEALQAQDKADRREQPISILSDLA